jgi:hypothetical protein
VDTVIPHFEVGIVLLASRYNWFKGFGSMDMA